LRSLWSRRSNGKFNINQYADKDDVLTVSREINGYVSVPNGFNDRKLFTEILKKVMKYETCKNKK
jgi:predicted chitinase